MHLYTPPSVCQISRQSNIAFAFYSSFCKCAKRERKIREKKTKKFSQFLKSHISGMLEAISLKFGMWSTEVGGSVHSKHHLVSSRQHRATEVQKLRFHFSSQYTQGCCVPASWAARHTTVCLDTLIYCLCLHLSCLFLCYVECAFAFCVFYRTAPFNKQVFVLSIYLVKNTIPSHQPNS